MLDDGRLTLDMQHTYQEVRQIRRMREDGWGLEKLAKRFKMGKATIRRIGTRETYGEVPEEPRVVKRTGAWED